MNLGTLPCSGVILNLQVTSSGSLSGGRDRSAALGDDVGRLPDDGAGEGVVAGCRGPLRSIGKRERGYSRERRTTGRRCIRMPAAETRRPRTRMCTDVLQG